MLNYNVIDFMAGQLADQYATQRQAGYRYKHEKDLPKVFRAQAAKLAANGVTSIYDVRQEEQVAEDKPEDLTARATDTIRGVVKNDGPRLINVRTGEPIKDVKLGRRWETDPEAFRFRNDVRLQERGKFTRWGWDVSVEGQADYGISFENGVPVYTPFWKDTATKILGMNLEDAVKTAIAVTAAYYGGSYLMGGEAAAGAGATTGTTAGLGGGTGLTPGAAGSTGLTLGTTSTGIGGGAIGTGLTAPAGFTLAPGVGASLAAGGAGIGLLDSTLTSSMGETGLLESAAGEGFKASAIPSAAGMGGAQGLTVPVAGGTVTASGLIPAGAPIPLGGGPERGLLDTLRTINSVRNMLTQPTVQQQAGLLGGGQASQPRGVDFSPLYQNSMVGLLPLAERYRRSLI